MLFLTIPTYDDEKDGAKNGGETYYDELKKELSLQGQVCFRIIYLTT